MLNRVILFSIFHALFFLILFYFTRPILSADAYENFFWGMEWQLGYYKHPPLFAWMQEVFTIIFGVNNFTHYFVGRLFIFLAFIGIFFLAKEYLPQSTAFLCVLMLELLTFSGINSRTFNADLIQVPIWVFSALFYIYAFSRKKAIWFLLLGFVLGLAFLSKYSSLLLCGCIFFSAIISKETRKLFKSGLPYITLLVFILTIAPHVYWLFQNNFMPFNYISGYSVSSCKYWGLCGLRFFAESCASFLLVLIGFSLFSKWKFRGVSLQNPKEGFLIIITLTPFLLTFVLVTVFGTHMRKGWGAPLFFFLPIFLFYFFNTNITQKRLRVFYILISTCFLAWILSSIISYRKDAKKLGKDYDVIKEIAIKETEDWNRKQKAGLKFVIGETWAGGLFSMFSKDRPSVIPCVDLKYVPYITKEDLITNGYISICKKGKICNTVDIEQHITTKREYNDFIIITSTPKQ